MAEQSSHNVVNHLESTNGSAPSVDVAENHTTSLPADSGKHTPSTNAPLSNDAQSSYLADTKADAEPSAGDAVPLLSVSSVNVGDDKPANGTQESLLADDRAADDASADPSVTSDNDAQSTEQSANDGLTRGVNSVKKPTTFSRVSVTKNFLAKSAATPPPTAAKIGDKSTPTTGTQPAALRPRLVAKTAASLSNISRTRLGTDGASSGPEAGTVWNKNRPAPAMPPKQFTDEELKQQYGIHMATRLQSDDAGKGSKWADIDDDEDDWAPEAVVWMDGTKSTLTTSENMPATEEVKATAPATAPADTLKPSLILNRKTSQPPATTTKTILKPGAAVQAKQQSTTPLASASEKQVLIAKSPAPTPSKSPWAALPPVESVSPINPPVQFASRPHMPFPSQDARAGDPSIISNHPAREIAADTFDRSWPQVEGEHRELFNSANGKYEPAPEGRRNSIRYDRKHAVLRRPSHTSEHPWPHRRGSSVSQNSGNIQRPMSVAQSVDSHGVLSTASGDRDTAGHALASGTSAWASQLPPPPSGEASEDPVKVQERVMREGREAARQRRQEKEAQEEAEKQARLQAKLAALAGAGVSRKERQQASSASDAVAQKTSEPPQQENAAPTSIEPAKLDQPEVTVQAALSPPSQSAAVADPSPRLTSREHIASSAASRSTFQSQISGSYQTAPSSAFSSPGDRERKPQPFARTPLQNHDGFSSVWPSTGTANVWGGKGIGNGTFESAAFAPLTSHHQALSLPAPPGMGRPATTNRVSPQNLGSSNHSPILQDAQLAAEHHRSTPTPDLDLIPDHFKHHSSIPNQSMGRQQHAPGPIAPPSRAQPRDQLSAWQSAAQMPSQYNLESARPDGMPEERRNNHRYKETFTLTGASIGGLGGPRRFERINQTIIDNHGSRPVRSRATRRSSVSGGASD